MIVASLRPGLVLAGRSIRRQRLRAVVILATLVIPVAAATAADIITHTTHLTAAQQADRLLGSAQAVIDWTGYPVDQAPNPADGQGPAVALPNGPDNRPGPTRLPFSLLPAGAVVVGEADTSPYLISASSGAYATVRGVDLRAAAPAAGVRLRSGHVPTGADDIALSPSLAAQLRAPIGSILHLPGRALRLHIVGIVADRYAPGLSEAFTTSSTALRMQTTATSPAQLGITQWYVAAPTGVPWSAVKDFNRRGWTVTSRLVLRRPPPSAQIPTTPFYSTSLSSATGNVAVPTVLAAMLLLEVTLMAGPAFAVGARRRRHEMALISAAGGSRPQLIAYALADGLVLGTVAAVVGAGLGIASGVIWLAVLRATTDQVPGSVALRGGEITGIALLALVSGLGAALLPAISASRADPAQVLRGRHGRPPLSRRPAVGGVVVLTVAIALGYATLDKGSSADAALPLVITAALVEVGFVLLTPAALVLVGRLATHLPLWPRLAARDSARNRSAAAPAVAAIIAVMAAATATLVFAASLGTHDRLSYVPSLPTGDATAYLSAPESGVHVDAAAGLAAVRANLPGAHIALLRGQIAQRREVVPVAPGCPAPTFSNSGSSGIAFTTGGGGKTCLQAFNFGSYLVDSGPDIATALGGPSGPIAAAALRAGRAVVFQSSLLDGRGDVTLALGPGRPTKAVIQAVAVLSAIPDPVTSIILPPATATRLRLQVQPVEIYIKDAARQPASRIQAVKSALGRLGIGGLFVQAPYHDGFPAALVAIVAADLVLTLAATVAATALVTLDSLDDLLILAAVGASPQGRRRLTMSRAAVIAAIGAIGGVLAGLVPGIGVIWHLRHSDSYAAYPGGGRIPYPINIPWAHLAVIVIGAPVLAVAAAALVHRFTLPTRLRSRRLSPA